MQPLLSSVIRRRKLRFFAESCKPGDAMLEVGSGSGWSVRRFRERGVDCKGLDLQPPADIVGDIREWKALGLTEHSFDAIAAFEVLEHVECLEELRMLLKPGGTLLLTTPVPRFDSVLRIMEHIGLLQRRTSPHINLRDIRTLPGFRTERYRRIGGVVQWGIYRKIG